MRWLISIFILILIFPVITAANICQYASSANATSQNSLGSLAIYATGVPNAPNVGTCTDWSGYGYTWSPTNWNVKSNLTLKYDSIVNVTNFTISGDYDMCWNKMWLKNSATGQQIKVFDGFDNNCISTKSLDSSFKADTIILETCGWSWSSTDAVQMCGKDNIPSVNICGNGIKEGTEECDNTQCAFTECDNLDRCNGNDYYNYSDVTNSCLSNCSCEHKLCTIINITYNDSKCIVGSVCGNNIKEGIEECDDGNLIDDDNCSSECLIENVQVYFVPYMGDFDGSIGSGWYYFYEQVRQWHEDTKIKTSFSFYPDTMNNPEFNKIIGKVYNGSSIELITKGEPQYNGIDTDLMSYEQVKSTLGSMQNKFITELTNLNYTNVNAPVTYNQNGAKFTNTIRNATHDLGFNFYMDQYVSSYGYIFNLPDYDITQYSESITISGLPGANEVYKQPEQMINELINYDSPSPNIIYINGIKVVPMLSHQQDFRVSENSDILNQTKWDIYTIFLLNARKDPRIKLLLPQEVYNLRHPGLPPLVCGNNILEIGEQCDDGNLVNGDGCSSECKIENSIYSVEICDWQNCTKGVASISMDDSETSCMDELNANGFKGTYFLEATNKFSASTWTFWDNAYKNGHELGAHTQTHPCKSVSETTLRSELSSNKNDILTHITNISSAELVSFAWPCGYTNEQEKQIANDYFLGSRGYYWNQLEDKNPADFMDLKSFNSPRYNDNALPPNYLWVADQAEIKGKWANFVLHNSCDDDGVINYLPSKDLWVAPIGSVVKYIKERQNTQIINLQVTSSSLSFNLTNNQDHDVYNKNLTINVLIADKKLGILKINNINKNFYNYTNTNGTFARFNVVPSGNDFVEIIFLESNNCVDNDKDGYFAFSADCPSGNDCNDNNITIWRNLSVYIDNDKDSYGIGSQLNICSGANSFPGYSNKSGDCNDNNININPGKKDLCDNIDNNCNLLIDEDYVVNTTNCGVGACKKTGLLQCINGITIDSCVPGLPLSVNDSTCDRIDDNCNGVVDENCIINNLCQYASSANATSQNSLGSLAIYATGVPNAPNVGTCTDWSGYGYTWSPTNWNVKSNLTLKYDSIVNVTNFTISGDYDMCWNKMWLKNSATGQQIKVFDGFDNNCISTKSLDSSFKADTIILETCGWSWSSTDAVQMCGKI